ncbi:hypothetical protein EBZ80_07450 [bacterium]|nr:hypothetical protein [bacterium]
MTKKTSPAATKSTITRIWLHGASGRMGLEIQSAVARRRDEFMLMGGSGRTFQGDTLLTGRPVDPEKLAHALSHGVDVVIDFSIAAGNAVLCKAMAKIPPAKRPQVLVGTTGLGDSARKEWAKIARTLMSGCVFMAPNTSRGVLATIEGALRIQEVLGTEDVDVAIVETHHKMKKDAPSGTAKMFADRLATSRAKKMASIPIVSVRGGGVFGEHEIRFMGSHDEIILTHRASSRGLFADGALDLAGWLNRSGQKFKSRLISLPEYAASLRE